MSEKILLSTDIGSDPDDAFALLAMLNAGMNLQGIYTVNGDVNARSYIAKHIVNLAGKNIPVARGVSRSIDSLAKPHTFHEGDFVDDVFVDEKRTDEEREIIYQPLKNIGVITNGLEHLTQQLKEPHTVFSIGPLTNIALLLREFPNQMENIKHLYIMGGSLTQRELEHNFAFDPVAATEILKKPIPITILPVPTCYSYQFPLTSLETLTSPQGKYVHHMAQAYANTRFQLGLCRYKEGDWRTLKDILKDNVKLTYMFSRAKGNRVLNTLTQHKNNLTDYLFDHANGVFEPHTYAKKYQELRDLINDDVMWERGQEISNYLGTLWPEGLHLADAYIPFCFAHSDKITTQQMNFTCDFEGRSFSEPGKRHRVVTQVDKDAFKRFVHQYLQ